MTVSINIEHFIQERRQESAQVTEPRWSTPMFFQLCTVIALIPLVLSLNIMLESPLETFRSAPMSLRWEPNDPVEFVLGAFTNDVSVMVATTTEVVVNFTTDRIVDMTFNRTSSSRNDCILLAWLPQAQPRNPFAQSEPFTLISRITTATLISGTASNVPPKPVSHTGVIVGGVIGFLGLGCMAPASLYVLRWRRRSKAGSLPFLRLKDIRTPTPAPFLLKYSSQRDAGAQEHVSTISRESWEIEIARVREEIRALRLDNQIRRMEAGYEGLPPPSYRSASSSSRPISFDT
ncbi:hypothetical protein IW261DRAFT_1610448 [Armillaria novae-zelandiae]|uniref:Transmembrane protein n=1 Tax=Armillaria novae-zelandiae TaxID=153914 RepID=A0AA39U0F4_9AGAR|nr:hypothetical protein IW261DRAFT_1610448 [Armillaria novae-zelandiae]